MAIPLAAMYLLDSDPQAVMQPNMLPFLFEKLAIPIGIIISVGALFLTCLIGSSLMEAIGTLMEPIMRPIWKTPDRSAIDAVASFAGSYSVGLLLTNRMYKAGRYSAKEAVEFGAGVFADGERIGEVTAPMYSMVLNQSLAMIQIKPSYARPDVKVEIKGETLSCTATTHTLPFYDPDKKKRNDS